MKDIIERLDKISEELEAIETPDDAYARGWQEARQQWDWDSALGGVVIIVAVLVVIWGAYSFIHWAAQPDYRCYAAVDTSNGSMFYHCDK